MSTYKVANAIRMNVVGYIHWQNNKKYDELLSILESKGFINSAKNYWILVENYGLAFAVLDRKRNAEFLYLTLYVDDAPDLTQ